MKTMQMHAVRSNGTLISFKHEYTEPLHHTVSIDEQKTPACVAEAGDRIVIQRWEGAIQNDDGISSGGIFVNRSGTITEIFGDMALIEIDNYGQIISSAFYGVSGYPNHDMQPENGFCGYRPK